MWPTDTVNTSETVFRKPRRRSPSSAHTIGRCAAVPTVIIRISNYQTVRWPHRYNTRALSITAVSTRTMYTIIFTLDAPYRKLVRKSRWYRIRHHNARHDQPRGTVCQYVTVHRRSEPPRTRNLQLSATSGFVVIIPGLAIVHGTLIIIIIITKISDCCYWWFYRHSISHGTHCNTLVEL